MLTAPSTGGGPTRPADMASDPTREDQIDSLLAQPLTSSETLRDAVRIFGPDIEPENLDELEDDALLEMIL